MCNSARVTRRYNFTLEVGALTDQIEVTADRADLIAETSPTIGQVFTEEKVRDLLLVTNNVLDLMKTMPGVRGPQLKLRHTPLILAIRRRK
jgi:hypothetical protein